MASVIRRTSSLVLLTAIAACGGDLLGLDDGYSPIGTVHVKVQGSLSQIDTSRTNGNPPRVRAALVWGGPAKADPFCVFPPTSDDAEAVVEAGCPDPFAFLPAVDENGGSVMVKSDAPVSAGGTASFDLTELPPAEAMVGEPMGRVAYGSVIIYHDDNRDGFRDPYNSYTEPVLGASFATMTAPDKRIAFREGDFGAVSAYYPRRGCPAPPKGFSILGAGGMSRDAIVEALSAKEIPKQDPSACTTETLSDGVITVDLAEASEPPIFDCAAFASYNLPVRYSPPPPSPLELSSFVTACIPSAPPAGEKSELEELVAAQTTPGCKQLAHYALRGCSSDLHCEDPEWDVTKNPPSWWPCKVGL